MQQHLEVYQSNKYSMRILIVTHAPLSPEFGAGQMAINLGDALRRQGYEVTLWSPHPLPSVSRWFRNIQQLILMRKKLEGTSINRGALNIKLVAVNGYNPLIGWL
ncbi:MAG: hypothetical protein ACO36N_05975 [Candidatus Nanopelagicales bacterium]